jgi:tetratricopeptide (TPR) repeat protein
MDPITFPIAGDLQCTAWRVPGQVCLEAGEDGALRQYKLYYQQDTVLSFNKAMVLTAIGAETGEAAEATIPAGMAFRPSDYASLTGVYSPETGTVRADEAAPSAGDCLFEIADAQSMAGHVEAGLAAQAIQPESLVIPQAMTAQEAANLHWNRALAFWGEGTYEAVLDELEELLRLTPQDTQAFLMRADALNELSRPEEALQAFETAEAIQGEPLLSYHADTTHARILYALGRYPEAMAAFLRAASYGVNDVYAYRSYVVTAALAGDFAAAQAALEAALALPGLTEEETADFLAMREDVAAELSAGAAAPFAPEAVSALLDSAYAHEAAGRYEEALTAYNAVREQALALGVEAYTGYIATAAKAGDFDAALNTLDAALALPGITQAQTAALLSLRAEVLAAAPIGRVTMTYSGNLRAAGSADSALVGKAVKGESFDCLGIAESGWYHIVLPDGSEGYVSPRMATLAEE